jgi:hypothetical protein
VLTAFAVVLGTLVIQGLTLKPLLRALDLHDDDPVGRELHRAPPESRGLAMGAYTAFLDLALGLANPALGLVASGAGLGASQFVWG